MDDIPAPMCIFCRHLREDSAKCEAFPEGIPDAIMFGSHDHRMPYDGDGDILFELRPGGESVLGEWLDCNRMLSGSCELLDKADR